MTVNFTVQVDATGLWKTSEQGARDKLNCEEKILLKCSERQGLVCVGLEVGCVTSGTVGLCYNRIHDSSIYGRLLFGGSFCKVRMLLLLQVI